MTSLKDFYNRDNRYIFICLNMNDASSFICRECGCLGTANFIIVELDGLIDGQAACAYLSREHWIREEPLLIYNIDAYFERYELKFSDIRIGSDAWIPCFRAAGDHWSFVKLGPEGWAIDCSEKKRISEYASIRLYWFARAGDYIEAYEEFFSEAKNLVDGERYIAPMYNYFIENGGKVSVTDVEFDKTHVQGTPKELNEFLRQDIKI